MARTKWIAAILCAMSVALSGSMLDSSALAQCQVQESIPSLQSAAGGVVCVSVVPIGVLASTHFATGCSQRYVIKPEDGATGNWGFLDFGLCREGVCGVDRSERLECQLTYGYSCIPFGPVSTMTGARRGALRDAMQTRFASDTDRRQDLCFDQYVGNGQRIVLLPLTTAPGNGKSVVRIIGFSAFFLRTLPGEGSDAVEAEYLHDVAPGP